ncbi:hypothetical protein [Streptomyces sp. NPDC088249]|uniref:hypothetical protein n=1 Tax=Streptomyces sp. NPDC088249 TaxID=3365843 RepID=UPI003825BB4F
MNGVRAGRRARTLEEARVFQEAMMRAGEQGALTQEAFEDLARHLARLEEASRLEFVNGKPGAKALPDGVRYEQVVTVPYGKTVELSDPVGIELDTEPLKNGVH